MSELSIQIPNTSESLARKLEAFILGGTFWPDQPLAPERQLALEFDVSRTTLRTALAQLTSRGMLTLRSRKHYVTPLLFDVLRPGLIPISKTAPEHLLDYWLHLFCDAVQLAAQKARSSDRANLQTALAEVHAQILSANPEGSMTAFLHLARVVFDSCYNFFLAQTHLALVEAMHPALKRGILHMTQDILADPSEFRTLAELAEFQAEHADWRALFGLELPVPGEAKAPDQVACDPAQLIAVVTGNSLALEALYELRLLTESRAAESAATHVTPENARALQSLLERMTVTLDTAPDRYSQLDTELHALVARTSSNPFFGVSNATLAPVLASITRVWLDRHLQIQKDQSVIHQQHVDIVAAICAGQGRRASQAMQEHLDYVLRGLRLLRQQDGLAEIATARRLLTK